MYISVSETAAPVNVHDRARTQVKNVHEFMRQMPGFRWAMLLHCLDAPETLAVVSMWLSPDHASAQDASVLSETAAVRGYDVVTARGAMTPATHIALVDWEVPDERSTRFADRWNAAYHAVEDRIGSRLLRDLAAPARYTGLHAVTSESHLDPQALAATVEDAEGLSVSPLGVRRYAVVLLTEAGVL